MNNAERDQLLESFEDETERIISEQEQEICKLHEIRKRQDIEIESLRLELRNAYDPIRRDTYAQAVAILGKQSQCIMAMEEMSELTKAITKNLRGKHNVADISEEMADVEIMLEQLKVIYGNRAEVDNYRAGKLIRLAERLASPE